MFWGVNLKEGKNYDFPNLNGKIVTFSNACLSSNSDNSKFYLSLSTKSQTFNIAVLQKDKLETTSLNHTLLITGQQKLSLTGGKGEVSVTGFIDNAEESITEIKPTEKIKESNETKTHSQKENENKKTEKINENKNNKKQELLVEEAEEEEVEEESE